MGQATGCAQRVACPIFIDKKFYNTPLRMPVFRSESSFAPKNGLNLAFCQIIDNQLLALQLTLFAVDTSCFPLRYELFCAGIWLISHRDITQMTVRYGSLPSAIWPTSQCEMISNAMGTAHTSGRITNCCYAAAWTDCEYRALAVALERSGEDEFSDDVIAQDACQVSGEGYPGDVLHVPAEGNLLKAHHHHAGSRPDDEH